MSSLDDFDFNATYTPPQVKFHTLRNVVASGLFGAIFEARKVMSLAPGSRFARCMLAGVNTMFVGAVFFGSQSLMGHIRLEDDFMNSVGAGLVTGSVISSALMSAAMRRPVNRGHIMGLWAGIGLTGHALSVYLGIDRIPDFPYDPIQMTLDKFKRLPPQTENTGKIDGEATHSPNASSSKTL